jgi:hypothetical protein
MRCPLRIRRPLPLFAFTLGTAAVLSACGGSSDAGPTPGEDSGATTDASQDRLPKEGAPPDEATDGPLKEAMPDDGDADVAADAPHETMGDGSCEGTSVWNAASLTFTLTRAGGFVAPPPADAGCTAGTGTRFDFSLPEATLAESGCSFSGRFDSLVRLSQADVASVVASVGAIQTTCAKDCGADAPTTKLTVSASGVQTTYTGNFYAGCLNSTDVPPFVTHASLSQLESDLHALVTRACAADAGVGDAGTCVKR